MKLITIDITAKEWFDKINGNSYFSAQIVVNLGYPDEITIYCPFQYGYGSHYEYMSFAAIQEAGLIPKIDAMVSPSAFYRENNIIARATKKENYLKKDVKAWGKK